MDPLLAPAQPPVRAPEGQPFDRITRTARRLLAVSTARVELGVPSPDPTPADGARGTPSQHVVRSGRPLHAGDLQADPRFAAAATEDGVRAYAGHPLRGPHGGVVGVLCVTDVVARAWGEQDRCDLADLAAWAEVELAQLHVLERLDEADRLRSEYASVLDHAGQGILGIDRRGTVLLANVAALRLTGWQQAGLVGRDLHETFHPVGGDGLPCDDGACTLALAVRDGRAFVREVDEVVRRDGSTMPVRVSCAPTYSAGRLSGAVLVFDDVTEQQAVDRMKDEFVSVVSHELRTPLTSLRGSLGLLASGLLGPLGDRGQHLADIAVTSTDRLVRLVDDILDLERLSAGETVLLRRQVQLAELLSTAVEEVRGLAEAGGVVLEVEATTAQGWFDHDRIVQVLVNLVGNAVKFSEPGTLVRVTADRAGDGAVVLRVVDRGRGIPPEQLARIFDRFAQVDSSDSRAHGGSGLGLAIARNVVQAHGGTITATSTVGEGTSFEVVLPQRAAHADSRYDGRRDTDGRPA